MSKKSELLRIFTEYKNGYAALQAQANQIYTSKALTPVGREQAIKQLIDGFMGTAERYHNSALEVIDTGLEALKEKWKKSSMKYLNDTDHQVGLSNILKMLELGAITDQSEIENVIEIYADDSIALAAIRQILLKSSNESIRGLATMISVSSRIRERNKDLLIKLRGNVDRFMASYNLSDSLKAVTATDMGISSVVLNMDGMTQFVNERLGDDLELLN